MKSTQTVRVNYKIGDVFYEDYVRARSSFHRDVQKAIIEYHARRFDDTSLTMDDIELEEFEPFYLSNLGFHNI